MGSMDGKVVLVTGSTQGIGLQTAVGLAKLGARVTMVGRDRERSEAALAEVKKVSGSDTVELLLADLSSLRAVKGLADELKSRHDKLDVLLNNAGAIHQTRKLSADGIEMTFAVNHLAYMLLVRELLPLLTKSAPARIVNVASEAHRRARFDLGDLEAQRGYSPMTVYGNSKLANILYTRELSRRLAGSGVTANCLHPGVVATGFGRNDPGFFRLIVKLGKPFLMTPEKGARTSIWAASAPELANVSGEYFKSSRIARPNRAARDDEAARRLFEISERMLERALSSRAA
jgi:NAD(P)-dependent dehydrogenase (short-subunit alcohol dehydrogenase family)